MGTVMVRIGRESHQALQELSEQAGEPMSVVLARAIEEYGRKRFLEGANDDLAALRRGARNSRNVANRTRPWRTDWRKSDPGRSSAGRCLARGPGPEGTNSPALARHRSSR